MGLQRAAPACHEIFKLKISAETPWSASALRRTIRGARTPPLHKDLIVVRSWRRFWIEKYNIFALRLSPKMSWHAAPAKKSRAPTSPNTAPAAKTHTPPSPLTAPATEDALYSSLLYSLGIYSLLASILFICCSLSIYSLRIYSLGIYSLSIYSLSIYSLSFLKLRNPEVSHPNFLCSIFTEKYQTYRNFQNVASTNFTKIVLHGSPNLGPLPVCPSMTMRPVVVPGNGIRRMGGDTGATVGFCPWLSLDGGNGQKNHSFPFHSLSRLTLGERGWLLSLRLQNHVGCEPWWVAVLQSPFLSVVVS